MKSKVEPILPEPPAFRPVRVTIDLETEAEAKDLLLRLSLCGCYVNRASMGDIISAENILQHQALDWNTYNEMRSGILKASGLFNRL